MPRYIACLTFDLDAILERLICGLIERGAVFTTMEQAAREYQTPAKGGSLGDLVRLTEHARQALPSSPS